MLLGATIAVLALSPTVASSAEPVPQESGETAGFTRAPIHLDAKQMQTIGVTYGEAERRPIEKVIRTVGRFDYDERKMAEVTLKVAGYVGDLFVDYTGKAVRKGDPLFTIYSPDLVSAQQEYLLALETRDKLKDSHVPEAAESAAAMVRASRERLRLWDLTDRQIRELEEAKKPKINQVIVSPISGVVTEKMAFKGHAVEPGMVLYKIADLSAVWVYADVYEYEVPLVKAGQEAKITLSYYPDKAFTARVDYVYPTLDPKTRTVKVRFELANSDGVLRPEMYGDVELRVPLGERLVVPANAILDAGRRQIVFVDGGNGRLVPRDVRIGYRLDDVTEVKEGLSAGERVVTSGNFLVDSESKLQGAESMMGMMGSIGMGDWKMESARPMNMGGGDASMEGMKDMKDMQGPEGMKGMEGMPGTGSDQAAAAPPPAEERKVGDLVVAVFPAKDTAKVGENSIRVRLRDADGKPVSNATVSFNYTMDMPGMAIEQSQAKPVGDGVYEGGAKFTMGGPWGVVVQIDRPGQAPLRQKFTIRVSG
jgi:membrane fusion protein, copper/silver efflux system